MFKKYWKNRRLAVLRVIIRLRNLMYWYAIQPINWYFRQVISERATCYLFYRKLSLKKWKKSF